MDCPKAQRTKTTRLTESLCASKADAIRSTVRPTTDATADATLGPSSPKLKNTYGGWRENIWRAKGFVFVFKMTHLISLPSTSYHRIPYPKKLPILQTPRSHHDPQNSTKLRSLLSLSLFDGHLQRPPHISLVKPCDAFSKLGRRQLPNPLPEPAHEGRLLLHHRNAPHGVNWKSDFAGLAVFVG